MRTTINRVLIALLFCWADHPMAYEVSTHALITFNAYKRARLGADSTVLTNLGLLYTGSIAFTDQPSLGELYLDTLGSDIRVRRSSPYESNVIRRIDDSIGGADGFAVDRDRETTPGWLMTGAIREDDNPREGPHDDPFVPAHDLHREFNHFFDPATNRPLTVAGLYIVARRAPDWALGVDDAFANQTNPDEDRDNHFTVLDAREALWRALTLKQVDSLGILRDVPSNSIPGNTSGEVLRKAYWATTFRALGDVLHLNQDMAQPQHTRNEPHSGVGPPIVEALLTGHESAIEKYIDARARRADLFNLGGVRIQKPAPLTYPDYPIPRFDQYAGYWSTGLPPGQPLGGFITGRGLADYSNRGFFTQAANFDNRTYSSPSTNPANYEIEDGTFQYQGVIGSMKTQYLKGKVLDSVLNSNDVIRMTARGLFKDAVSERGIVVDTYTLDSNVLDDQAKLLIPRAIAYSAGLLDYFFRGELTINLPDDGVFAVVDHTDEQCRDLCGFSNLKLKLRNTTATGEAMSNGMFVAVTKFHRNTCYQPDLSGDPGGAQFAGASCRSTEEEILVSEPLMIPLNAQSEQVVRFNFRPPIPINATDIYLQVVFRGQLGKEADAVVVTTKNISEPNYIAVVNDLDYQYDAPTDSFKVTDPKTMPQTVSNIDIKLNGASTPLASLSQLNVRGYAQLAFLTDLGSDGTEPLAIDFSAGDMNGPLSFSNFPLATFTSSGPGNYQRSKSVYRYRGMWSDYRFDLFSMSDSISLYSCLPGDARRICTSAGLTTIPASNAVTWTINFP